MGWNDHSPAFEMIERRQEEILQEAFDNDEIISEEAAYMQACDDVAEEMRAIGDRQLARIRNGI